MRRLAILVALILALTACSSTTTRTKAAKVTSSNPLNGESLFVDPINPAIAQVQEWRAQGQKADAATLTRISSQQVGLWLANEKPATVTAAGVLVRAAAARHQLPLLVIYNIPQRDCGGFSSGGAPNDQSYLDWVYSIANVIGTNPVLIIMEPDAVPQMASGCVPAAVMTTREHDLTIAIRTLRANPNAKVYMDAGGPFWGSSMTYLAQLMRLSGSAAATGFALNVSNFQTLSSDLAYGQQLSPMLDHQHFVIDTSRNGAGPYQSNDKPWCNPPGRKLGHTPTTNTGTPKADAFLWIKQPGASDGTCRGGPPAGTWWASYALALASRS